MSGFLTRSGLTRPDFFCPAAVLRAVRHFFVIFAASALAAAAALGPAWAQDPAPAHTAPPPLGAALSLPRIPLLVGERRVTVEVAANDASRARGLMFRERLAPDHGMLFVFPRAEQLCFWMKNTPLPLTVAFIDEQGRIVSLADMQPHTLDPHCAIAPALYALEMEQGWFARHGVRPGAAVRGLPRVAAKGAR